MHKKPNPKQLRQRYGGDPITIRLNGRAQMHVIDWRYAGWPIKKYIDKSRDVLAQMHLIFEFACVNIYIAYIPQGGFMRTAKLFKNGGSQAIRLPKDFRFEGSRVFIKKVGNAVVLLPRQDSWQVLFDSLDQFTGDFMATRDQPEQQVRENF